MCCTNGLWWLPIRKWLQLCMVSDNGACWMFLGSHGFTNAVKGVGQQRMCTSTAYSNGNLMKPKQLQCLQAASHPA